MKFQKSILRNIATTACLFYATSLSALDFTVLSDIHVIPGNENERQLYQAIQEINQNDSEFVIVSGDLSNEGSDEQLHNVKKILDTLTKPVYVIPGNHEDTWSQSAMKTISDIWTSDRFVFETDSLVFIGINCGPYMKMGDGHIKQEDLIWLDTELARRCNTSGKKVVSVNHYPIKEDLDNYQDYLNILHKYPTIVHICGHYHVSRYYKGGDIDAIICRALDMTKKNDGYGYTNFTITQDSVFVNNKTIGQPERREFAFYIHDQHPAYEYIEPEKFPEAEGFSIRKIYQDNASIFTRLAVDKDRIIFGNSLGLVKSIDMDGNEQWSIRTQASLFSRPALTDSTVIIPTADKRILWLDKENGQMLQDKTSEGPYVADGLIVGDRLYQGGYKKFECWNAASAELVWKIDANNYCQAEPVIDGDDVVFGAWDSYLRCVNRTTGELKWKWNNGREVTLLGPGNCVPMVTPTRVIVVAPDRYMTVIDRQTGKEIWRTNFDGKYKVRESLGASADGKIAYAKTMDGQLLAVNITKNTPEIAFVVDAGLGYEHAPCIVKEFEGVIYMGSRQGVVVAVDAATQKVLWQHRCGTSEVNGFEQQNGKIYASLTEGAIWEFDKL